MTSMQAPLLHAITLLAFVLHIGGGVVGLLSGVIAVSAQKGGQLHRTAGKVFVASMVVMAVFACYLAIVIPDQIVNVFISIFALYLILTAWLTVKRRNDAIGFPEKVTLFVSA